MTYLFLASVAPLAALVPSTALHFMSVHVGQNAVVPQSEPENIQPIDTTTFNCTVQTGTYDGEQSFYWFKDSEDSFQKMIYTHEGRNNKHDKINTKTHTCVYNLPLNGLDLSYAVNYYCAVASCGQILLGKTTNVDLRYDLVTFLCGACAFTSALSLLLAFSVCRITKNLKSSEFQPRHLSADVKSYPLAENISDAALAVLTNRSIRQNDVWSECVYYPAKQ
ncbi:hypothetical protein AMECASPLE_015848 [Ameca splendens]|uniref:Ig-like domain-containing protein n=1 Tax=Ameca splendens TaxID=208324 RepID=A0ABV0ZN30_9TELE